MTKARLIVRAAGFALLVPAIALLIRDLAFLSDIGLFAPASIARYWQNWSPQSFMHLQSLVQQHVSWQLWDSGLAPLLQMPAFLLIGGAGLLLVLASLSLPARRSRRRSRDSRRGTPSRAAPPA